MPDIKSKLKKLLKKTDHEERCGLILNDGTIIEVENTHDDPVKGFKIPVAELAKYEDTLLSTWHTHPNDTANLSQEDDAGFRQWPELTHYVIGVDGVRAFEVTDDLVIEVDL